MSLGAIRRVGALLGGLLISGCALLDTPEQDPDGDGYTYAEDCAPFDHAVYPGADEVCGDGVFNDCEGSAAEARATCGWLREQALSDVGARAFGGELEGRLGYAVAGVGDLNGDGLAEVVIGAPYEDGEEGSQAGRIYIFPGSEDADLAEATVTLLEGPVQGAHFGASLAGGGDVDRDGVPDLLVGVPRVDFAAENAGGVYLLQDLDQALSGEAAGGVGLGSLESYAYAGTSVDFAGDVNADGFEDIVVGAPGDGRLGQAGTVHIVFGPVDDIGGQGFAVLDGDIRASSGAERDDEEAGAAVAGVGDTDGDGRDEVIVGAPGAGRIYLLDADAHGSLDDAPAVLSGEEGSRAGASVAGPGDLDGDGVSDLLIGAPWGEEGGVVYLVSGPARGALSLADVGLKLRAENSGDALGSAVAGPGDVDRDGSPDLLLGAPGRDVGDIGAGGTYVVFGPVTGPHALGELDSFLLGDGEDEAAGSAVDAAGDCNGDGVMDLLVGAPGDAWFADDAGAAYLVLGRDI